MNSQLLYELNMAIEAYNDDLDDITRLLERNIDVIAKRNGVSLDQIAELYGISTKSLGRYKKGQVTPRPAIRQKMQECVESLRYENGDI
ncbi:hypothetical protein PT274_01540 [Leuconostocaceae bacterium ESL0958]|nr:hypothetical protein [Leuconostocaceae bacterium ESL0958]